MFSDKARQIFLFSMACVPVIMLLSMLYEETKEEEKPESKKKEHQGIKFQKIILSIFTSSFCRSFSDTLIKADQKLVLNNVIWASTRSRTQTNRSLTKIPRYLNNNRLRRGVFWLFDWNNWSRWLCRSTSTSSSTATSKYFYYLELVYFDLVLKMKSTLYSVG